MQQSARKALTVDDPDQMRVLALGTGDIDCQSNQRVDMDVMESPLQMMPQIISFVAEELTLVDNYSNLIWHPSGCAP